MDRRNSNSARKKLMQNLSIMNLVSEVVDLYLSTEMIFSTEITFSVVEFPKSWNENIFHD